MKKIVIHSQDFYDKLQIDECETPMPKADEVLIEVVYAGINYADIVVQWRLYKSAKEFVG